jgi:peptidoglycan/xylan/chitin deacetylase (PgdA/CDA1 family)
VTIRTEIAKAVGKLERRLLPGAPVILIYHRVAEVRDDWGIVTPPKVFAEQIEAVRSVRDVVSLSELLDGRRGSRRHGDRLAAITFDDGYQDVFTVARPILDRLGCPSTVFITTGLVDQPCEFWWDELAFILLESGSLPATLRLDIGGRPRGWRLAPDTRAARERVRHELRRRLRNLSPIAIERVMTALRDWAGVARPARSTHRVMSSAEIDQLRGGPMQVGAHTVSHPALPHLPRQAQAAQIEQSRKACEDFTGERVEHFAYPFGDYDGRTSAAVRDAGFVSACTAAPGVVRRGADPYRLPRVSPGLADAETLLRVLG